MLFDVRVPPPVAVAAAAFVGAFGLPRWIIKFLTKRRQNKFVDEFANAIDIIVRGVKSGLPLNECLGIIARESPSPLSEEFQELVEQQRVGVPLQRVLRAHDGAHAAAGGEVLLDRHRHPAAVRRQPVRGARQPLGRAARPQDAVAAKVKALSAEAKASAAVLGALPFIVMMMVYMSAPAYLRPLAGRRLR
ncbi:MAG: type II secretion system F family protein [Polyangiaceae bacterium]